MDSYKPPLMWVITRATLLLSPPIMLPMNLQVMTPHAICPTLKPTVYTTHEPPSNDPQRFGAGLSRTSTGGFAVTGTAWCWAQGVCNATMRFLHDVVEA